MNCTKVSLRSQYVGGEFLVIRSIVFFFLIRCQFRWLMKNRSREIERLSLSLAQKALFKGNFKTLINRTLNRDRVGSWRAYRDDEADAPPRAARRLRNPDFSFLLIFCFFFLNVFLVFFFQPDVRWARSVVSVILIDLFYLFYLFVFWTRRHWEFEILKFRVFHFLNYYFFFSFLRRRRPRLLIWRTFEIFLYQF